MTSSPKNPANNSEQPLATSSSTAVSTQANDLTQGASPADGSSPSSAGRDGRPSWKDSLRSSHRSTKRRGGGRFLLSQYFHYDASEKRGRSPAEPVATVSGKGKGRMSTEESASGSAQVKEPHKQRTSSTETKSTDEADEHSVEEEGRRSTSMDLEGKRDRTGQGDHSGSLDASRIVSMALNLSEGRRRNVSGSHLIVPQSSSGHRAASGGMPTLHGQYGAGAGGSLRKHLQDQRRVSRGISNDAHQPTINRVSNLSYSMPVGPAEAMNSSSISVSHGTISRVEKAKRYIELAAYYKELLGYLPPLKPRVRYAAPSSNGRIDTYPKIATLGREYNPLQLIRNRKARVRERVEVAPDPPTWDNSQAVKSWLELVEAYSEDDAYVDGDEAILPDYPTPEFQNLLGDENTTPRYKRPRVDWVVSPPELLADAYWLEHDQHKSIAEDRNGDKLFHSFWASTHDHTGAGEAIDSDLSSPRMSLASDRARDSDGISERRGRDYSVEDHGPESSARAKQVWPKARRRSSSASSGLSYSDDERGNRIRRIKTGTSSSVDNTGPLEKSLSKLMSIQSSKKQSLSPSIISPGTPDKRGAGQNAHLEKSSGDADVEPMDLDSWKTPENVNRKREHLFTPEVDSSSSSPVLTGLTQSGGQERVPEGARVQSPKKSRRLLPFGKGDNQKTEKIPFNWPLAQEKSSRHSDTATPPRQSLEVPSRTARPPTRDSYADTESPQILPYSPRTRSKDRSKTKSFAGGIISSVNDFVRNEGHGRFRRKKDASLEKDITVESPRPSMDGSEADQSSGSHGQVRKSGNGNAIGNRQNEPLPQKPRPRVLEQIDLPTFRPTGSPSGSRPGTPNVEKSEKRLLPAFRPLSRSRSREPRSPEAPTSDSQPKPSSPPQHPISENHQSWPINHTPHHAMIHSSSDLARLRALLLCSGIKASGLMDSLMAPRPPAEYLGRALLSTDSKNDSEVPLASQPMTAASHLTSSLNAASRLLHQNHAMLPARLNPVFNQLTTLRSTATTLVEQARKAGDDAVNTTAMMTGQKTIEVRRVIDAVDSFRRKRRRRLRWIRRMAFGGLEWGVLLFMWVVWAVVMIVNVIWKGTRGVVRVVRWALWL